MRDLVLFFFSFLLKEYIVWHMSALKVIYFSITMIDGICLNDPMSIAGQLSDILLSFKLSSDAIRSLISLDMCVGGNLLITRGLQQAN
jgi:hypothetical protein